MYYLYDVTNQLDLKSIGIFDTSIETRIYLRYYLNTMFKKHEDERSTPNCLKLAICIFRFDFETKKPFCDIYDFNKDNYEMYLRNIVF